MTRSLCIEFVIHALTPLFSWCQSYLAHTSHSLYSYGVFAVGCNTFPLRIFIMSLITCIILMCIHIRNSFERAVTLLKGAKSTQRKFVIYCICTETKNQVMKIERGWLCMLTLTDFDNPKEWGLGKINDADPCYIVIIVFVQLTCTENPKYSTTVKWVRETSLVENLYYED